MIFRRLVYITFTILLLFADSGQTIYAHTCLKTNRTSITFAKVVPCCKNKATDKGISFNKANCCRVNSALMKQVVPAKIQLPTQLKIAVQVIFAGGFFNVFASGVSGLPFYISGSSPEPLSKAGILFTQVFRC
jgi:hypothetical protein